MTDYLGKDEINRIYDYADVFHCEPIEKVADEFVSLFAKNIQSLQQGDPLKKGIQLGPLARLDLADTLANQLNKSLKQDEENINKIYNYSNKINFYKQKDDIGNLLFNNLGLFRNEEKISTLIKKIEELNLEIENMGIADKSKTYNKNLVEFLEFRNVLNVALLVSISALNRKESRGSHFRLDYPLERQEYEKNTIIKKLDNKIIVEFEEIV